VALWNWFSGASEDEKAAAVICFMGYTLPTELVNLLNHQL